MTDSARPSAAETAEALARWMHRDQLDKSGKPYVGHLSRVAASVSDEAKAAAWLHDICEDTPITCMQVFHMFGDDTGAAVQLLTHDPNRTSYGRPIMRTYREYIDLIKSADGEAGDIAREVKIADLRDNLSEDRRYPGDESIRKRHTKALGMLTGGLATNAAVADSEAHLHIESNRAGRKMVEPGTVEVKESRWGC